MFATGVKPSPFTLMQHRVLSGLMLLQSETLSRTAFSRVAAQFFFALQLNWQLNWWMNWQLNWHLNWQCMQWLCILCCSEPCGPGFCKACCCIILSIVLSSIPNRLRRGLTVKRHVHALLATRLWQHVVWAGHKATQHVAIPGSPTIKVQVQCK